MTNAPSAKTLAGMRPHFSQLPAVLLELFFAAASLPAPAQDIAIEKTFASRLHLEAIAYEHGEGVASDPAPPPDAAPPVVTTRTSVDCQAIAPRKIFDLVMKIPPPITKSNPSWRWRLSLQNPTSTAWRGHPGTSRG